MCTFTSLFEIRLDLTEDFSETPKIISLIAKCLEEFEFTCSNLNDLIELPIIRLYKNSKQHPKTILVSCYTKNLISLDFNEFASVENEEDHREYAQELQSELEKAIPKCNHIKRITPIKRGRNIWNYSEYSDGRLCEDMYTEIVFDQRSKYQHVTIANCKAVGNTLILDDLENMSDSDNSYTVALLGLDEEIDYKDKTILILGGGDGGALHELRKLGPSMITMVEIDEVVMKACRKYLRRCCGDSLDSYTGDNYEIIVGDCLDYLDQYINEGRLFDYVVSDITDIPIEATSRGSDIKGFQKHFHDVGESDWKFFDRVYNACLKLVQKGGLILTHVTAEENRRGIERFKKKIGSFENVEIKMRSDYIPTFAEKWTFCKIKKKM